ncbi:MAG: hypothetical protein O2905_01190 [Proteobacteria bacterium]|nr:hypothetical protein [Pseudomonadota bacterium]MDA1131825.1 hypothetical protein [Pseudomonadota bacterium]
MDTNYEVYSRRGGRWNLDARYGERDKTAALEDARGLEREAGVEGVRVVLEIHNPGTGETTERTVYMSAGLRKAKREGQGHRAGGAGAGGDGDRMIGGAAVTPFDDEDDDDDDEPEVHRGWVSSLFRRRKTHVDDDLVAAANSAGGGDSEATANVPRRPIRASRVVMKFMLIVVASFGIATATTFLYTWTM